MSQHSVKQDLWTTLKSDLKTLFPRDIYETWFEPIHGMEENEKSLTLSAPNEFAKIWIQDNYLDLINQKAHLILGRPLDIIVKVFNDENGELDHQTTKLNDNRNEQTSRLAHKDNRRYLENRLSERNLSLNPANTFENFIVGTSNQLAHAASVAVAEAPARAYNPLFLYGDSGLGKTHLMHAIAHTIVKEKTYPKVIYVSCEKFTNEYIRALQENKLVSFRKDFRNIDVLLIDDIQFLAGKEGIQEEFFHTFNDLFESQRQICLSSDRPASEISKLESRLLSRFQWGMVTDIQAPDLETRVAILSQKAASRGYNIPVDVIQFLAERITRNVRRLEGALTRVACASVLQNPLDISHVEQLLLDILQEEALNQITIEMIQKKVVEYYQLRLSDMVSKRRPNNIAFPRQIAMYISRLHTNHSLQDIGEAFGGRDHGTVIHACKTVENIMEQDESVARSVEYLTKQLTNQNPQ